MQCRIDSSLFQLSAFCTSGSLPTEEEKQYLRDTLSAAHDEGELDYHEIWGWNERGGTEINRSETTLRSKGIIFHGAQNKNGFHSLGDVLKEVATRNGDSS